MEGAGTSGSGRAVSAVIATPFGPFGIDTDRHGIVELIFLPAGTPPLAPANAFAELAAMQIMGWLDDPERPFDLPLRSRGTPFQRRVWAEISLIQRGRTRSYGALAERIGSAARAVGQACGANPFPLVVPCHRVVSASGIGGFAHARGGELIATKQWLLARESNP